MLLRGCAGWKQRVRHPSVATLQSRTQARESCGIKRFAGCGLRNDARITREIRGFRQIPAAAAFAAGYLSLR
jgi:hypothetical protein